jgi:hypothetical protein
MLAQFGKVSGGWVAFMLGEIVFGIEAVVFHHCAVALNLRDDARSRDAEADGIPSDQCSLRARKIGNWQTIDQDMGRTRIKLFPGTPHSGMGGTEDVQAVYFFRGNMNHRPTNGGILGNLQIERIATAWGQFFGVIETDWFDFQWQYCRSANYGTSQWASTSFVNSCDRKNSRVAERNLVLKRARHSQSRTIDLILNGRGRFTLAGAEVIEFGATNSTLALYFDLGDARRVDRENPLYTLAVGYTTNGEVLVDASALAANHNAGINLNALLVAFDNAGVDFDCVTDIEWLEVGLELFGFNILNYIHKLVNYCSGDGIAGRIPIVFVSLYCVFL